MCVAIGRKLQMFQWKHSAAWTAWCPASDTDTVDGFTFLWVRFSTFFPIGFEFQTFITLLSLLGAEFERNPNNDDNSG